MADVRKDWRELCNAAIAAKDTDELLRIVNELNATLEREEKARRKLFNGGKISEFRNNSESGLKD
jgi:hypothetical protein